MNSNQIVCLIVVILLVLILMGIFLIPQKGEKYIAEEVMKVNEILNIYPEILEPSNSIHFMKLLDVLVDLSRSANIRLDRSQIRQLLMNLANRKITDFASGNLKTLFLELILNPNIIERVRNDLKYKITSSLKSIISDFVLQGISKDIEVEDIFRKMTQAVKSEMPLNINSSQITDLLKSIFNSNNLRKTSMYLPEMEEFKKLYTLLDNPRFRDNIFNKFLLLLMVDRE